MIFRNSSRRKPSRKVSLPACPLGADSPRSSSPAKSSVSAAPSVVGAEDAAAAYSTYTSKSELGRRGEGLAAAYLQQLGYRLVAANFSVPVGQNRRGAQVNAEIDLIAYDEETLCFVEVKTRSSDWFAAPSASVDLRKQRQITRGARAYRRIFGLTDASYRYDVVSIILPPDRSADSMKKLGAPATETDDMNSVGAPAAESDFRHDNLEKDVRPREMDKVAVSAAMTKGISARPDDGSAQDAGVSGPLRATPMREGVGRRESITGDAAGDVKIELLRNFWTEEKFRKRRWQERYWD